MCANGCWLCRGDDREVGVLGEMGRGRVVAIDPHGAQRARLGLGFAVHEVIKDEGAISAAEQSGESNALSAGNVDQFVVVDDRFGWKATPQRGDSFRMVNKVIF